MLIRLSNEEYKQSVLRDCNIYRSFHYPRDSDINFVLSNFQSRSEPTTRIRSRDTHIRRRGADKFTSAKSENGNEKEQKTAKVSLIIILVFCISWFPYATIALIGVFGDQT